jgi:Restriction Enzyme Adenine Methylase Associated
MKSPSDPEPLVIVVMDLIDHGFISPPTTVFGTYGGSRIEAILTPGGIFVHHGNEDSSPSVAAGRAITAETGVTSTGRNYFSVNGWKFWQVIGSDGESSSLADLRKRLLEC